MTGTGTTGLRIRAQPGLQGEVRFLGIEAEVFRIIDGPRQADDYTWWHLQAPYDESLHGWAVADFLSVIQR